MLDNPYAVRWDVEAERMKQAMLPGVEEALTLGLAAGAKQIGMDWLGKSYEDGKESLEEWVAQAALAHALKRAGELNANTEKKLRRALELWKQSGGTQQDLELRLELILSQARAETIGTTEVTELYYKGEEEVWKRSKKVNMLVWVTAADERVCPTCAALHGKTTLLGLPFPGGYFPPSHARCACIAMVLEVGKDHL